LLVMKEISSQIKYVAIAALALGLFNLTVAQENILLVVADDLGADSVGLYSSASTAPTPIIDSLAQSGVRFTNAWAHPTCSPTRAGFLTGRHAFRTGVGAAGDEIALSEFTTAQALSNAGYATACIGKWHLSGSSNGNDDNPNLMGFDHYEGAMNGGIGDYYNWTKVTNGSSSTVTNYGTTENVDNAISWIAAQSGPWFCQLAFNAPHTPFHKPPNSLHSYDSLPGTPSDIQNNPTSYYQAAIESLDTELGRLLNSLSPSELANTNIIFIGDNGTPRRVSPGVVRDFKGRLYEGGVHVPFIVSGPAVASPLNRTNDATIHTVDLFATILELAGLDVATTVPAGVEYDSVSVVDYLANPAQAQYHAYAYTERFSSPTVVNDGLAIRDSDYKLIYFDSSASEEFYHIQSDPTESTDLLISGLNATEQTAYDLLSGHLDTLLNGGGGSSVIDSEDFESGWGIWNDGGSDARRALNDAAYANSGSYCIRLRDDTNTSVMTTDVLDLSGFSSVTVEFSYIVNSFEGTEDFWLQVSTDGGVSFSTVEEWNLGDEFSNNVRENETVTILGSFSANTLLRFRCDASNNGDHVFIDDVVLTGQ
ncbi:MAG: sulfatase-like hydrolase/transferase, partial [Verrucomicrobiota bacterium]